MDKLLHLLVGFAIGLILTFLIAWHNLYLAIGVSVITTGVAADWRERQGKKAGGIYDPDDFAFTMVGCIIGILSFLYVTTLYV